METERKAKTLIELLQWVLEDYRHWNTKAFPWFRGEPLAGDKEFRPLIPKLYRPKGGKKYLENRLLQQFRVKAPALGLGVTPPVERTDQWLFLAQHVGLPTRLLDWTEGLLLALHFALEFPDPVVWMLNPHALNLLTYESDVPNAYGLTWLDHSKSPATRSDVYWLGKTTPEAVYMHNEAEEDVLIPNAANFNIRAAWELDGIGTKFPFAILPTYVHSRMSTQKSCFTIWGTDKRPLHEMERVSEGVLKRYLIDGTKRDDLRHELRLAGISRTTLFSDLDRLAGDLSDLWLEAE